MGPTVGVEPLINVDSWLKKTHNKEDLQSKGNVFFCVCLAEDINAVYKKMALELHPDKGGDPEKFQELQEMKDVIRPVRA